MDRVVLSPLSVPPRLGNVRRIVRVIMKDAHAAH
jgi:hypothetical protein